MYRLGSLFNMMRISSSATDGTKGVCLVFFSRFREMDRESWPQIDPLGGETLHWWPFHWHVNLTFRVVWVPWHWSRTHAKIWRWSVCVLVGPLGGVAVWRRGGGSVRGVAVRLVCCLWCSFMYINKVFFQSLFACLLFSSLLSAVVSAARWVLPASLLASLASCRFLSVWFALHRRAAVFGPVFWSVFPHRGNVFLQSKKVRRSFALFLVFQFCAFFCLLPLFFGLVFCAAHSFSFYS